MYLLIDSENVSNDWMNSMIPIFETVPCELNVVVFYTEHSPKISFDQLSLLLDERLLRHKFEYIKVKRSSNPNTKNELDFALSAYLGIKAGTREPMCILSKDNGYHSAIECVQSYYDTDIIWVIRDIAEIQQHLPALKTETGSNTNPSGFRIEYDRYEMVSIKNYHLVYADKQHYATMVCVDAGIQLLVFGKYSRFCKGTLIHQECTRLFTDSLTNGIDGWGNIQDNRCDSDVIILDLIGSLLYRIRKSINLVSIDLIQDGALEFFSMIIYYNNNVDTSSDMYYEFCNGLSNKISDMNKVKLLYDLIAPICLKYRELTEMLASFITAKSIIPNRKLGEGVNKNDTDDQSHLLDFRINLQWYCLLMINDEEFPEYDTIKRMERCSNVIKYESGVLADVVKKLTTGND